MTEKARAVGINHVALEVGDIDEALAFYGAFLDFEIAERSDTDAFIYFGDQFLAFMVGGPGPPDQDRCGDSGTPGKEHGAIVRIFERARVSLLPSARA